MSEFFSHERMFDRSSQRDDASLWMGRSANGVVATAHYLATQAGAKMLAERGNAIDAAVAASVTLGVVEPAGSGLGGMAVMTVYWASARRVFTLAAPCVAPSTASPAAVRTARNRNRDHVSVAVPTYPAVMEKALQDYGSLPLECILSPAIEAAERGYPLTPFQRAIIVRYRRALRKRNSGSLFLGSGDKPLAAGSLIRQPALARTLRRLATAGWRDFYEGEIAREIDLDMRENGGFVTNRDLATLPRPDMRDPLRIPFNGLDVFSPGPPAGGIALLQMLNVVEHAGAGNTDPDTAEGIVRLAAIIRQSRADRRSYRLRTGVWEAGDAAELLTAAYANQAASMTTTAKGSGETSHISVADRWGNLVSLTQSLDRSFGAAVMAPNLGFLYNGFLRAFKVHNKDHPHYLRPGVVARSNTAPTILLNNGQPWGAIGNTGSERLASGILETLIRVQRHDPFTAVAAPRFHCSPEGVVSLEAERFSEETLTALRRAGFTLDPWDAYSFQAGGLNLVVKSGEEFVGVGEPRRDSAASGPIG